MSSCKDLGITQSDGQPFPGNAYAGPQIYPTSKEKQAATGDEVFTCFYVDYSDAPRYHALQSPLRPLMHGQQYTKLSTHSDTTGMT